MRSTIAFLILGIFLSSCQQNNPTSPEGELRGEFAGILDETDNGEEVKLERRRLSDSAESTRGVISSTQSKASSPQSYSNYGYSPAINSFLAYADKAHWQDPSLISIMKLAIGGDEQSGPNYCGQWDLRISSNQSEKLLIGITNAGFGSASQVDPKTIALSWKSGQRLATGIIFGISGQVENTCLQPLPEPPVLSSDPWAVSIASQIRQIENYYKWYGQGVDPYKNGYQGNIGGYYYYSPPPLCAATHVPLTLKVTGTVRNCDGGRIEKISVTLDKQVNDGSGQSPVYNFRLGNYGEHRLMTRNVNYNGSDWYMPKDSYWYSRPEPVVGSCDFIQNEIIRLKQATSVCTTDSQCSLTKISIGICEAPVAYNTMTSLSELRRYQSTLNRNCPNTTPPLLCSSQVFTKSTCVQRVCVLK